VSKPPAKTSAASKTPATKEAASKASKPAAPTKVAAAATKAPAKTPAKTAPKPGLPAPGAAKPAASGKAAAPALREAPAAPSAKPAARPPTRHTAEPPVPARPEPHVMTAFRAALKADPKLANAWKHKSGRDLSEQELLAMPDSEYMNEKQLDFFRTRLQAQKDDLLSNAGETTEHLREDTTIVPDPADRATIEEEHALELRTRDRERKLLKKIAQSLARLESGEYGYCDETGEPIGLARLLARPTATLSLEAQQRRELKQKMFGD